MNKGQTQIYIKWLMDHGLPEPVTEHRFHDKRRWRFDLAWPDHLVSLEIEGAVWTRGRHTRGSGFIKDIEKYNMATVMGWRVLRSETSRIFDIQLLDQLRRLLGYRHGNKRSKV